MTGVLHRGYLTFHRLAKKDRSPIQRGTGTILPYSSAILLKVTGDHSAYLEGKFPMLLSYYVSYSY